MNHKILFCDVEDWEKEKLERILEKSGIKEYVIEKRSVNEIPDISNFTVISPFIYSKIDEKEIERAKNLKLIVTRSTGFDHIDMEKCKKRKITVCNIPDYGTSTVAEYTVLLILALLRKFKQVIKAIEKEVEINPEKLRGNDLKGKVVGIIGAGRIGTEVAKILHSFQTKILYFDIRENNIIEEKYRGKRVSLEELLRNSDIITLHVPLTPSTYHLINKKNITLIKKNAILVNTSRGSVVETEALIYALENDMLKGVALDVFEGEEIIKKELDVLKRDVDYTEIKKALAAHVLSKFENVILSPHIAYNTEEALERILEKTIETIKRFQEGKELYNKLV